MIQYSKWISLSLPTRAKIAEQFSIPKIRSTSVINNVIADDGYDVNDMEKAMTVDNLQTFLNSDDINIDTLFQHLVDVMEDRRTINAHVEPEPILIVPQEIYEKAKEAPSVLADTSPLITKPVSKSKK